MQLNFPRCNIGWLRVSIFFCLHPPIPQLSQLFLCVKHFQSSKGVREKRELFQPQCYTYSIQVERHRHNQKQKWLWIFNQIPFRGSSKFYRVNLPLRTGSLLNEHRSQENLPHFSPRSTKMCFFNTFLFVRVTLLLPPRSELATIAPSLITQKTLLQLPLLLTH